LEEEVKLEVTRFIDETLEDLASVWGVPKPLWYFMPAEYIGAPQYAWDVRTPPGKGAIWLPEEHVLELWRKDKEKTRLLLKHFLAHEFKHYLQHRRWGTKLEILPTAWKEGRARAFAFRYSGITYRRAGRLIVEILAK